MWTARLTQFPFSYYNLATDLYEYGWGASFHFCRFAYGETFAKAIARHEHYLAHMMGLKEGMRTLDVGCGVGGPAREMVKFTGANVVGLNNNDYQIERATRYAAKEGLSDKLSFTKGDFMVCTRPLSQHNIFLIHASKCRSQMNHLTPFTLSRQLSTLLRSKESTLRSFVFSSQEVSLESTSGS